MSEKLDEANAIDGWMDETVRLIEENATLKRKLDEEVKDSNKLVFAATTLARENQRLLGEMREAENRESELRNRIASVCDYTTDMCTCGGAGPDDPKACDGCKIYHALTRAQRKEES